MNILVITHTTPNLPNKDGITLILYYLLQQLNHQHTFTILARDQYSDTASFVQAIHQAADQAEVSYVHGPEVLDILPQLTLLPHLVVGVIDTQSYKYAQLAEHETSTLAKRQWLKQQHHWQQFEHDHLSTVPAIIVGTPADRSALLQHVGSRPFISVIANGVDSDYFAPDATVSKEPAIIFSGLLDQPSHIQAIVQFAKTVWPLLKKNQPTVTESLQWYVVGKDPDKKIMQLVKKDPHIIVTGFVPEVKQFLIRCQVFVSPLHLRSGIRNTVLEAMACGLPVVAYSDACTGLEHSPIRKVTTPTDFANTTIQLLSDANQSATVGAACRKYVVQHHHWSQQAQLYATLFTQAHHAN